MKTYFLISLLIFYSVKYSSSTLLDGIVKYTLSSTHSTLSIQRFLTNNTQIHLQIHCHQLNKNQTQQQMKENLNNVKTKLQLKGKITYIAECLLLKSDKFINTNHLISNDLNSSSKIFHKESWSRIEQRIFTMQTVDCLHSDEELFVDEYSNTAIFKIPLEENVTTRKNNLNQQNKEINRNQSKIKCFIISSNKRRVQRRKYFRLFAFFTTNLTQSDIKSKITNFRQFGGFCGDFSYKPSVSSSHFK